MKGYKVFNSDWTCIGFKFEVGKVYEHEGEISLCNSGFHFCAKANDCFNYYSFDSSNKVAEVEAIGKVLTEDDKSVTNKIQILRELTWQEVLEIVNIGKANAGRMNIGNRNTGNRNIGNRNTGDGNIGIRNTGDGNIGDWNTGIYNTGDWNTGDWNKTNNSSGCFNTEIQKIKMFDKESDWTLKDWENSDACYLLSSLDVFPKRVESTEMTDKENLDNPSHTITGGFLRKCDASKVATNWWNNLNSADKKIIRDLPNYDEAKFSDILGIKEEPQQ